MRGGGSISEHWEREASDSSSESTNLTPYLPLVMESRSELTSVADISLGVRALVKFGVRERGSFEKQVLLLFTWWFACIFKGGAGGNCFGDPERLVIDKGSISMSDGVDALLRIAFSLTSVTVGCIRSLPLPTPNSILRAICGGGGNPRDVKTILFVMRGLWRSTWMFMLDYGKVLFSHYL